MTKVNVKTNKSKINEKPSTTLRSGRVLKLWNDKKTPVTMIPKRNTNEKVDLCTLKLIFKETNQILIKLKEMQPKCSICLEKISNRCYLDECLHSYCLPCISKWVKSKKSCPCCSKQFTTIFYNVKSVRTYHRADFDNDSKYRTCLLRAMIKISSYFQLKESLNGILNKYDMSFETFHNKVTLVK